MRKYIFIGLFTLAISNFAIGCQHDIQANINLLENAITLEAYKKQLDEQHAQNIKAIKVAFGIDDTQWRYQLARFTAAKIKDKASLQCKKPVVRPPLENNDVTYYVKNIMAKYNINPETVLIKFTDKLYACHAIKVEQKLSEQPPYSFEQHTITINRPTFDSLDAPTKEAAIAHECMHLINYDPAEESYILGVVYHYNPTQFDRNHPVIIQYRHHMELRADAFAITNKDIANKFIQNFSKHFNIEATNLHPSKTTRYSNLQKVNDLLHVQKIV